MKLLSSTYLVTHIVSSRLFWAANILIYLAFCMLSFLDRYSGSVWTLHDINEVKKDNNDNRNHEGKK